MGYSNIREAEEYLETFGLILAYGMIAEGRTIKR